jgi:hypothetical protein
MGWNAALQQSSVAPYMAADGAKKVRRLPGLSRPAMQEKRFPATTNGQPRAGKMQAILVP